MCLSLLLGLILGVFGVTGGSTAATSAGGPDPRAEIKQVVNAIESCAAGRVDGAYAGGSDVNCLAPSTLVGYEQSLTSLGLQSTPPTSSDQVQVMPLGTDHMGYAVQGAEDAGGTLVYFVEAHLSDGTLNKLCSAGAPYEPQQLQSNAAGYDQARIASATRAATSCNLDDGTW